LYDTELCRIGLIILVKTISLLYHLAVWERVNQLFAQTVQSDCTGLIDIRLDYISNKITEGELKKTRQNGMRWGGGRSADVLRNWFLPTGEKIDRNLAAICQIERFILFPGPIGGQFCNHPVVLNRTGLPLGFNYNVHRVV
jgi:hypothetical protein